MSSCCHFVIMLRIKWKQKHLWLSKINQEEIEDKERKIRKYEIVKFFRLLMWRRHCWSWSCLHSSNIMTVYRANLINKGRGFALRSLRSFPAPQWLPRIHLRLLRFTAGCNGWWLCLDVGGIGEWTTAQNISGQVTHPSNLDLYFRLCQLICNKRYSAGVQAVNLSQVINNFNW